MTPYIKDLQSGNIRPYGSNHHDSLMISKDGTYLTYEHLQCGDGSIAGDKEHSGYVFCDDEGHTPEEDETLCRYGADAYFNIGGWDSPIEVLQEIRQEIADYKDDKIIHAEQNEMIDIMLDIIDKYIQNTCDRCGKIIDHYGLCEECDKWLEDNYGDRHV